MSKPKKSHVAAVEPPDPDAPPPAPPDPWTCSECFAPDLQSVVRVGRITLCKPCFEESSHKSGNYVVRK